MSNVTRLSFTQAAQIRPHLSQLRALFVLLEKRFDEIANEMADFMQEEQHPEERASHAKLITLGRSLVPLLPCVSEDYEISNRLYALLKEVQTVPDVAPLFQIEEDQTTYAPLQFASKIMAEPRGVASFWDKVRSAATDISSLDSHLKECLFGEEYDEHWPDIARGINEIAHEMGSFSFGTPAKNSAGYTPS